MQFHGGVIDGWQAMVAGSKTGGAAVDARPPIASGYIKYDSPAAAQPSSLKPFEAADYDKLSAAVDGLALRAARLTVARSLAGYRDDCVNIFVPRITSSQERGLKDSEHAAKNGFNVILNSTDICYAGYFSTPQGMNAIVKVRQGGANVLKAGDILSNTNLKLKALNERYIVLENMSSRADEKVYLTSR
jgi:hypothetical protein